jgi:hypothetical protein
MLAAWLAGLLAYLFLVLAPKYLDRDTGVLGKFYLFRPSSLIVLLWLMLALAVTAVMFGHRAWVVRSALLAMLGSAFLLVQTGRLIDDVTADAALDREKRLLAAAVIRATAPGEVVLIDPDAESQLLDFERRTRRPTLVMWKFAPTNDAELIVWYRRMIFRQMLFDEGCGKDADTFQIRYLLTTPAHAPRLAATCGAEIFRVGEWVMLRRSS